MMMDKINPEVHINLRKHTVDNTEALSLLYRCDKFNLLPTERSQMHEEDRSIKKRKGILKKRPYFEILREANRRDKQNLEKIEDNEELNSARQSEN